MSEWIEIYINGEHSHDREIKFLPLNKYDIEKISNFHRHQCSDYGSFLIEIYLKNGSLIFSTEMPSQALSLKAAWIKCADKMPDFDDVKSPLTEYFVTISRNDGDEVQRAYYIDWSSNKSRWVSMNGVPISAKVTHWMPSYTPAPPQD